MMDIGGKIIAFMSAAAFVGAMIVFIPALIIFIINLVKGIKYKWPKKYLIPVIITGVILAIFATLALRYLAEEIIRFVSLSFGGNASSSAV